jgi:IS5 family transposase
MRIKSEKQQYMDFSCESTLKVVSEYRKKYNLLSRLLDNNPRLVCLVHHDLAKMLSRSNKGRKSIYTSEQILRCLIVQFVEQHSFRDVVVLIENSEFLRNFVRLGVNHMMDYSFLNKAYGIIGEKTWQAINYAVAQYAAQQGKISYKKLRMDTTVYETNIHYPTDSSLLWDSFRTLANLLRQIQQELPHLAFKHRFHDAKVKKLAYFIARSGASPKKGTQRRVKSTYRELISRVTWIASVARQTLNTLAVAGCKCEAELLSHYLPIVDKIIEQADKRVFEGVMPDADEKIYSLFEEHTELLKRGKAGKPIELGHKILLAQTGEKFIHHYQVYPKRQEDKDLLEPTLNAHAKMFGFDPDVLATDKGFYKNMEQISSLEEKITTVSICKKGRRNQQEYERESSEEFKLGQRFRAGCEGSISVLKRAFTLGKCLFRGFKNYAASVGCAVFCYNLVLLTRL